VIPCYSMLYHSGKACLGHADLLTVITADGFCVWLTRWTFHSEELHAATVPHIQEAEK